MGKITDYLLGRDLEGQESRTITRGTVAEAWTPVTRSALPAVSETTALRCNDIFACVRVLANAVASLPPRVYRRQPNGARVPSGDDQRLVQLLRRPEPGSTSADLFSTLMVHLLVYGDAFVAKYRSEGSIVQLAPVDPAAVVVERQGNRVIYKLSRLEGFSEHGPEDILHVKAMSSDGLRGLSTVRAAGRVLGLNQGLIDSDANPKAIQEFMGHSEIRTTFDTYGHLIEGSRDEVRRRIDAYLAGSASEELTGPLTGPPAPKAD
jgi:HK97 family phage portal protein